MNIGDMFQRISNGEQTSLPRFCIFGRHPNNIRTGFYPSALHRVVISGEGRGEETPARYSIPYFLVPTADGVIEPQPSLVAAHGKQVYKPVTFTSYSEEMFQATQIRD
jgi:isopenicillin N synthase-like dioxygenase